MLRIAYGIQHFMCVVICKTEACSRMKDNSTKNNFIVQAGILAAAGIISRIIGLLYRSPLQRVIGDLGQGYYHAAY